MNASRIHVDAGWFLEHPGKAPALRNVRLAIAPDGFDVSDGQDNGTLVMPSPVNAHDHGYGVRTLDFDCRDDALEPWIAGLRQRPLTDPYLEALVAFGRLAATGTGATMHCHNSLRSDQLVNEARDVIRAAKEVGIRLALSCPLLNKDPWIYGGPEGLCSVLTGSEWARISKLIPTYLAIDEQLAAIDAIADENQSDLVDVQYGPIGPQWCSDLLLERIAERSADTGRRIHMHLLESPRQRHWLDQRFPGGVVTFLDKIGFLSPRLAVAHGVQLRPDECELLAERGVTVVSNPAANLRLRSGIAPIHSFQKCGLRFAFGMDGTALDDDQDMWRELRLAWLLHAGKGMERELTDGALFDASINNGAGVLNQPAGCDFVMIDYERLTEDAVFDDGDVSTTILNRMTKHYVDGLIVAGRWVVRDGRLVTIDFDAARAELLKQAKASLPRMQAERETAHFLASAIHKYYEKLTT